MSINGSIQVKKGRLFYVFRLPDENGKIHQKWEPMGLSEDASESKKRQAVKEIEHRYDSLNMVYSKNILFVDWVDKWLDEIKAPELEPNTLEAYRSYVKRHVRPFFEPRKIALQKIKGVHVQEFYNYLLAKELSANSVKHIRAVIHAPLEWAYKLGLISENPAKRATIPKSKEKFQGTSYSPEEAQALIEITKDEPIYPAIYLAVNFGLRKSEILGLTWESIDLSARELKINQVVVCQQKTIVKDRTKTDSSKRTLPISESAAAYLTELWQKQQREKIKALSEDKPYEDNDFVCKRADGKLFHPTTITKTFKNVLKKYQLREIRFHDLRHTAISIMVNSGIDIKVVQAFAGHSDITTTLGIYAHTNQKQLQDGVNALHMALRCAQ